MLVQVKTAQLLEQLSGKNKHLLIYYSTNEGDRKMIRIEIDANDVVELKAQLKGLLNEPAKNTVTVTQESITVATPQVKEVKAPKAKKVESVKEAPVKEEPVKAATADELTEDQKTELRTLCAEYTHKVSDGKERIKQFLKDKGLAKVTELKPADLPEFKAMVQI